MSGEYQLNHFVATDALQLKKLEEFVHEEYFDVDDINYDSDARVLEIPFMRCHHGINVRKVKERILWRVHEVPILRCGIKFSNVLDYELVDTNGQQTYDVWDLKYSYNEFKSTIEVLTNVSLDLKIQVSKLQAEYYELGFRGKAVITSGSLFVIDQWEKCPRFYRE
jgi:hypothetical protein